MPESKQREHISLKLSPFLISYNTEVFLTPAPPEPHHYTVKNVKELLTGQTAKPQNLHQYKVRIKYWDNEVEQLEKSASYLPGKTVLSVALNVALNKCKSLLTLQLYHICSMSFWGPVFFSENPEFIAQYIWKQ